MDVAAKFCSEIVNRFEGLCIFIRITVYSVCVFTIKWKCNDFGESRV